MGQIEIRFPSRLDHIRFMSMIASDIGKIFYGRIMDDEKLQSFISEIELVVGEACTNSVNHSVITGSGKIIVGYDPKTTFFKIMVMDQNPEFDFNNAPRPGFESASENGYGIYIIKEKTDKTAYKRENGWNKLTIIKNITSSNRGK